MAERVLTLRELNRATLARQLLLTRSRLSPTAAVERLAGMQSQWAPAPYVGLWTRLHGFRREQLERATLAQRLVRAVLMRGTIHLVSRADYPLFGSAVGPAPWIKPESAALAEPIAPLVAEFGREPRTRAELLAWLRAEHGIDHDGGDGFWYALRAVARLAHAPDAGLWRPPSRTRYVLMDYDPIGTDAARPELVRRYLAAFGPASAADVAEWSGLRVRELGPVLERLEPLRRFRDESGRELLDLPRAPRPPAETPAPVRLLPRFDNLVLAHKDRTRVLPSEYRAAVIEGGMVYSTFLVDGFVAGLWRIDGGRRVVLEPFAPLPRAARRELEDEAARLEAWLC